MDRPRQLSIPSLHWKCLTADVGRWLLGAQSGHPNLEEADTQRRQKLLHSRSSRGHHQGLPLGFSTAMFSIRDRQLQGSQVSSLKEMIVTFSIDPIDSDRWLSQYSTLQL